MTLRIGLSHGDDELYVNYPNALRRIGATLGLEVEPIWLHERRVDVDGIVFTGGEDVDPARYGREDARDLCEIDATRDAFEWELAATTAHLPTLAVCRGAQVMNVYRGGTLIPHLANADDHVRHRGVDGEHALTLAPGSMLEAMAGDDRRANSAHHQAVDRLADAFRPLAHAPDGTLEAYAFADPGAHPFFLAVQWHPERMPGRTLGDGPIDAFLRACAEAARLT